MLHATEADVRNVTYVSILHQCLKQNEIGIREHCMGPKQLFSNKENEYIVSQ